ncbi:MAG: HD domain-containing protein [Patescibacteria group bacterium]
MKKASFSIPKEVSRVTETLEKANLKAFLVGGCVRDLLSGKKPKDWDVTTDATPEQIIALFPDTFYENTYGTVGVVNKEEGIDETLKVIEVTPFRLEADYSDGRRPDHVTFSKNIKDDLKRRDFTFNAIALSSKGEIVDLFKGQDDLKARTIRAVGNADERFKEDALRILRAVRIATEHDFSIVKDTENAIRADVHMLKNISQERIRDEFNRILMSSEPMKGLVMAQSLGILKYIASELELAIGVEQNQAHAYTVWEHLLRSMQHAADKKWPLEIRIAALFHDISKPETRRKGPKGEWTFYGHEVVGSRVTKKILERLKYSNDIIEKVTKLVRWHMFFSDTEQISLSAVRRMVNNVGQEDIWNLMNVRICDRIGTGRPKENPYRLRKYHAMIEEALRDPISVGMLKINGGILIKELDLAPGPKIGFILHALLEEVLEDPKLNTAEYLKEKAQKLALLPEADLQKLGAAGKDSKMKADEELVAEIRKKHWVE